MQKVLALILVVLGGLLLLKAVTVMWFLLLVLAAAFAVGSAMGSIGKWGYAVAVACVVIALPGLAFAVLGMALRMFHLVPILLVLIGIYLLFKSFK